MQTHEFGYRKWQHGKWTRISITVHVDQNVSRDEAKRIADQEILALREGHNQDIREAIVRKQERMTAQIVRLPDYRFVGNN